MYVCMCLYIYIYLSEELYMYTSIYIHIQREKYIYIYRCIIYIYLQIKKATSRSLFWTWRFCEEAWKTFRDVYAFIHLLMNVKCIYTTRICFSYIYIYIQRTIIFLQYIYIYIYIYVHTRILRTSNWARRLSMRSHHSVYVIPNSLKLREQKLLNW